VFPASVQCTDRSFRHMLHHTVMKALQSSANRERLLYRQNSELRRISTAVVTCGRASTTHDLTGVGFVRLSGIEFRRCWQRPTVATVTTGLVNYVCQ
jgi:hypothetical protein